MSNIVFFPVSTMSDLNQLDHDEQYDGYCGGFIGNNLPDNCTRDYWHGWNTGAVDANRIDQDSSMRRLENEVAKYYRDNKPLAMKLIEKL